MIISFLIFYSYHLLNDWKNNKDLPSVTELLISDKNDQDFNFTEISYENNPYLNTTIVNNPSPIVFFVGYFGTNE